MECCFYWEQLRENPKMRIQQRNKNASMGYFFVLTRVHAMWGELSYPVRTNPNPGMTRDMLWLVFF